MFVMTALCKNQASIINNINFSTLHRNFIHISWCDIIIPIFLDSFLSTKVVTLHSTKPITEKV